MSRLEGPVEPGGIQPVSPGEHERGLAVRRFWFSIAD